MEIGNEEQEIQILKHPLHTLQANLISATQEGVEFRHDMSNRWNLHMAPHLALMAWGILMEEYKDTGGGQVEEVHHLIGSLL